MPARAARPPAVLHAKRAEIGDETHAEIRHHANEAGKTLPASLVPR
jgi:hypothetical protein